MNIKYLLIGFIGVLSLSIMPIICVESVELFNKIVMKLRKPIAYENWMPDMMDELAKGRNNIGNWINRYKIYIK